MYESDGKKDFFFEQTLAWSHHFGHVDCLRDTLPKISSESRKNSDSLSEIDKKVFSKKSFFPEMYLDT